jgi:hypothetical protein
MKMVSLETFKYDSSARYDMTCNICGLLVAQNLPHAEMILSFEAHLRMAHKEQEIYDFIIQKKKMKPNWHYFESHITIDPVFDRKLAEFKKLAKYIDFHVANLLMVKKDTRSVGQPSTIDSFCTARGENLEELKNRTKLFVKILQQNDFVVRRYKIESTVIDSKYDDAFELL